MAVMKLEIVIAVNTAALVHQMKANFERSVQQSQRQCIEQRGRVHYRAEFPSLGSSRGWERACVRTCYCAYTRMLAGITVYSIEHIKMRTWLKGHGLFI